MRGFVYLFCLALMSAGVFVARYLNLRASALCVAVLAAVALTACLRSRSIRRSAALGFTFFLLGAFLTSLSISAARDGVLPRLSGRVSAVIATGRIASQPYVAGDSCTFFMDVHEVRWANRVFETREKVRIRLAGFRGVRRPMFSGVNISLRGVPVRGRHREGRLVEKGAFCTLVSRSEGLRFEKPLADPLSVCLNGARNWFSEGYRKVYTDEEAGLIEGVTLGKTSDLDEEVRADLKGCGLAHLVAVSGLHVGAAAAISLAVLTALGIGRRTRYVFAILIVLFVLGLADFRPSAARASIMAGSCFAGRIAGRDYDPLVGLPIAGLLMLGLNTMALFDPGFQMSFAAALGIVLVVRNRQFAGGNARRRSRAVLMVCAGAQLGIMPLMIFSGEGLPVTALVANMITVPLIGPMLILGWASSVAWHISPVLGRISSVVPGSMARFVIGSSSLFSRVPQAGLFSGVTGVCAVLIYTAGLMLLIRPERSDRSLFKSIVCLTVSVLLMFVPYVPLGRFRASNRMTVIDVGQGDAILLQDRFGGNVLIDGGPDEERITRKLKGLGVPRLDLVVLSHPHKDHYGGLPAVFREFTTGLFLHPGKGSGPKAGYGALMALASEKNIPCTVAREGQVLEVTQGLRLEVLYAPEGLEEQPENLNDCSIVIHSRIEGLSILLAGDIEKDGQRTLLGYHPDLHCDVLKVPHQGSSDALTPELIEACSPSIGVISVEKDNPYGHPSPASVRMMRQRGVRVFRTDEQGDITVSEDSGRIGVKTGRSTPR